MLMNGSKEETLREEQVRQKGKKAETVELD
jgi:hypothetical protein